MCQVVCLMYATTFSQLLMWRLCLADMLYIKQQDRCVHRSTCQVSGLMCMLNRMNSGTKGKAACVLCLSACGALWPVADVVVVSHGARVFVWLTARH